MQLKYSKEAEEAGIHIIGACGFDSMPADCGLEYLKSKFDGKKQRQKTIILQT